MKIKSKVLMFLFVLSFILLSLKLSITAQSATNGNGGNSSDPKCRELQKIIENSANGFRNVRTNESVTLFGNYTYNTNLQFSAFQTPMVIISDFQLYTGKVLKNAAVYQAYLSEAELNMAKTQYFAALLNTRNCLPNAQMDSTIPSGYISQNKFLVKDTSNNSEVTIFLRLSQSAKDQFILTLNVVSDKSADAGDNNGNNSVKSVGSQANVSSNSTRGSTISCDDLSSIFTESYNGYRNVRYNERLAKGNYNIYDTTLPTADFQKAFVQTTRVPLYAGGIVNAAHYQAFSIFKTPDEASALLNKFKASMKACYPGVPSQMKTPDGYLEQIKYLISVTPINSEISVVLSMLKGSSDSEYYLSFQAVSNLANAEPGIMKDPPKISTNKTANSLSNIPAKTLDICELLKILTSSAKNNFENLKDEEIPKKSGSNDSYEEGYQIIKKYRAKTTYSNFENSQIQQSIYNDKMNYYISKMVFQNEAGFSYMFKTLEERIKGCTNLNFVKGSSFGSLYDFKLANQSHPDGFIYDYYLQISKQEGYIENPRLILKFILSRK